MTYFLYVPLWATHGPGLGEAEVTSEPGGNKIVTVHLSTCLPVNQPVSVCLNRISNHILVTEETRQQSHSVFISLQEKKKKKGY